MSPYTPLQASNKVKIRNSQTEQTGCGRGPAESQCASLGSLSSRAKGLLCPLLSRSPCLSLCVSLQGPVSGVRVTIFNGALTYQPRCLL